MNLYIRYFDEECVVSTVEEAIEFLSSLPGMELDESFEKDLQQYVNSAMPYPKRYKVRPRVYFIVIKTNATSLAEFKMNASKPAAVAAAGSVQDASQRAAFAPERNMYRYPAERFGWYEGTINFKRVQLIPGTGKFQYTDTRFKARCKAHAPQECYDRIIDHLRSRSDIDARSQFPSARGKNFNCVYLGLTLPGE